MGSASTVDIGNVQLRSDFIIPNFHLLFHSFCSDFSKLLRYTFNVITECLTTKNCGECCSRMILVKSLTAMATEKLLLKTSGQLFLDGVEYMYRVGLSPDRLSVMETNSGKFILQFHSRCDLRPFAVCIIFFFCFRNELFYST